MHVFEHLESIHILVGTGEWLGKRDQGLKWVSSTETMIETDPELLKRSLNCGPKDPWS